MSSEFSSIPPLAAVTLCGACFSKFCQNNIHVVVRTQKCNRHRWTDEGPTTLVMKRVRPEPGDGASFTPHAKKALEQAPPTGLIARLRRASAGSPKKADYRTKVTPTLTLVLALSLADESEPYPYPYPYTVPSCSPTRASTRTSLTARTASCTGRHLPTAPIGTSSCCRPPRGLWC